MTFRRLLGWSGLRLWRTPESSLLERSHTGGKLQLRRGGNAFPPLHSHFFFFFTRGVVGNEEGEDESGKGWNVRSEGGRVGGFSGLAQRDVLRRDEDARQEVMKRRVKLQLMQDDRQKERGEEKKKVVRRKGEIK